MDDYEWKLTIETRRKGGPGSGNFGHAGRPGQVGGSAAGEVGGGDGSPAFAPGPERNKRRAQGIYDVISETDEDTAKVLLTQGIEPSFKPRIAEVTEYAPGRGLEREGLYVANDETFSKGSFGRVRLYMTTDKGTLKSPAEMEQLGRTDVDDALGTENGAVTVGKLPKDTFVKVAIYEGGKWNEMEPADFLESRGVDPNFRQLPSVPEFAAKLRDMAPNLYLRSDQVENMIHDYNRGSLDDKLWFAEEIGL